MREQEPTERSAVAAWLGVPTAALDDVSQELVEAMRARMTGQLPPASVLRDELLVVMKGAAYRLRQEADSDPLTALPNRRAFERELGSALGRRSADGPIAVLMLDLDGFKAVNDRLGHAVGDIVLCELGARLRTSVRAGDLVARWGGDEFVILWRDVRDEAVAELACKLQRLVETPIAVGSEEEVRVSASVGWAVADAGKAPTELIAAADAAMYRAKAQLR